ncbi:fimbrial protein [Yersinia intermedia]|uniref:fimbrial protein n=1 Tax=Yersinia intermedia TaxID=631 RepID=UPI0005E638F3|nr:fimbrial protein [Yersinia intermedia]MDA5512863.1 fimbrial protein [Yersinia intermedia]CNI73534.1 fimbrial protein BcfE [Yersinia intermedia]
MNKLIIRKHALHKPLLITALLLWSTLGVAGQSTTPLTFTATFVAGTCDITVSPVSIDWGTVSSTDIKQAGETGTQPRDLAVSYANCTGYGVQPRLKVTGTTLSAGIPLFTRTDGVGSDNALGYGVRLVSSATPQTALGDGDSINVGTPGALLNTLDGTQTPFQATLSCGNNCGDPTLRGGALNATVTFQFIYE